MMRSVNILGAYWLPVIIYCALIFIQSSYPAPEKLPQFSGADKLWHCLAYALMGMLFYRAFEATPIDLNDKGLLLLSIGCASIYGLSDEIHQYFVPARQASLADIGADICGSIVGVWVVRFLYRKRKIRMM